MAASDEPSAARPSARRKRDVYVANPVTNFILTAIFFAQCIGTVGTLLAGVSPKTCPLPPVQAAAALVSACLLLFPFINAVKKASAVVGGAMSRTVLAHIGDPLVKPKTMHKFQDQMWQLAIHTSMSAFETYILFYENGGVRWYQDYTTHWNPHPKEQIQSPLVHLFYLIQLAIWIDTCFSHVFVEERHKDYVMMYLHHLVTIMLVWGSYANNYLRVGTVVLFIHDVSDIPVDLLKIFNYLKLEGPKGLFLLEACFVGNLISWAYLRLYVYPLRVVWGSVWYGSREVVAHMLAQGWSDPTLPPSQQYTVDRLFLKKGRMGKPSFTIGAGDFPLLEDLRLNPINPYLALYWETAIMLTVLFIMHLIWYSMFWRILYRMLTASMHKAGEEVYEGESEDEKDD